MAAITTSRTERHSAGDLTLFVFTFSSIADADTFASGLPNVVAWWGNQEVNEGTAGEEGVNISEASGTFTFFLKTAGAGKLFVYSAA